MLPEKSKIEKNRKMLPENTSPLSLLEGFLVTLWYGCSVPSWLPTVQPATWLPTDQWAPYWSLSAHLALGQGLRVSEFSVGTTHRRNQSI